MIITRLSFVALCKLRFIIPRPPGETDLHGEVSIMADGGQVEQADLTKDQHQTQPTLDQNQRWRNGVQGGPCPGPIAHRAIAIFCPLS